MFRYTGSHKGCCPTHRQGEGKLCVGNVCNKEGKAVRSNGEHPRLHSADGQEGRAPAGVHTQGVGPASSSRAAGTANRAVDSQGGSAAPPGGGACLRPFSAAAAAAAGRPRSICRLRGQRLSERQLLRPSAPRSASHSSPRPLLRSDTPFCSPSRPPPQPGRA